MLRRQAWAALMLAFEGCATADADQQRKALLAYSQLTATYLKITEQAEILPRLDALEAAMRAQEKGR